MHRICCVYTNLGARVVSAATNKTKVAGTVTPLAEAFTVAPAAINASSWALERPACWLAVVAWAWATLKLDSWDTVNPTNVDDGISDTVVGSMTAIWVVVSVGRSLAVSPPIIVPTLETTDVSHVSMVPKADRAWVMNASIWLSLQLVSSPT